MKTGRVLCVLWAVCACAWAEDSRLVRIAQGPVRGHRSPEGGLFVFYNVPYATAPTGKDRFKAPLPPPKWMSPLDAVNRNILCPQADPMGLSATGTMQEDCLVANIYVPDTDTTNLPVVFTVHGGAYQIGHGNLITPINFVKSKKVIVVNFNYRLGVHGFLCLGTAAAPGNAGMKDQVAALRWVRANIASFGGNPDDITIHGYSAGSSAVDLLLLSKSTRGLFNKAIPESGANVGVWSVQIDPLENAKNYARELGFNNVDDIYALEEFYKTASYELLTKDAFLAQKNSSFTFSPCVERDTGMEIFLDDTPVNILKKGNYNKVPMLYGFANMEGLFRVGFGYEQFEKGMNEKFSDYLPADLKFNSDEEREEVARKVKEFYFGDKQIGEETIIEYIDYYSDVIFAYPTLRSLKLQVEAGNKQIYLYEYGFPQEQMMPPGFKVKVEGANHCAQTSTLLDGWMNSSDETNFPEDLREMKKIVREYWLNFMTTGSPSGAESSLPAWPAAGAGGAPHMALALPPQLRGELLPRRARFWSDIYDKYYRAPVPPPTPPPRKRTEL